MSNIEEFDLWADDEDIEIVLPPHMAVVKQVEEEQFSVEKIEFFEEEFKLKIDENTINIYTRFDLQNNDDELKDFQSLIGLKLRGSRGEFNHYTVSFTPNNSFVLRHAVKRFSLNIKKEDGVLLGEKANTVKRPSVKMSEDMSSIEVQIPFIKHYKDIMLRVNGYQKADGKYRVALTRVLDLESIVVTSTSGFPKMSFSKEVLKLNRKPIAGYDGTLRSLKNISVKELHVVSANKQSWKAIRSSQNTLTNKLESMNISSLHDLLFWTPRRYIDKSKPQDISDLIEGETAVILGKITKVSEITAGRGGAIFFVDVNGREIRTTFFNQKWLKSKFTPGEEVLITGKFSWWNRAQQITGASIEHSEEAAVLPIVPIYNQSPSKGITTAFIMAASRELISRMGDVNLPPYLKQEGEMTYFEALNSLHFPNSLKDHYQAIETLAFYELVRMQIIIQENKENIQSRNGLKITESDNKLQAKAILSLPFNLTNSQKKAIIQLNKKMENNLPSSTLLTAEVGAGKSIIAQMACLRAVDGGYQAALLAPTDILARQLYKTFEKIVHNLNLSGYKVNLEFVSGGLKAAEKKQILAKVASGETDIVVGTHALVTGNVKYANLGFIAIDEQQKFGADQRTKLLSARNDDKVPDVMMMTATPIPRSTAQVFYGDMDLIELTERPPGRLPIVTEWIEEDPVSFTEQLTNKVWFDVVQEAKLGNQTFVIAPLVIESDKIDSASVERTYESLKKTALASVKVAYVHGKMKQDEQKKVMEDFKNKQYDVLVASSVVEVGVDVSDATRVVILSADRFGSSSLHQIRGRVGRNSKQSKCYLVSLGSTDNSRLRLTSLVENDNGFDIAKNDLLVRGEGNVFSTEQSGRSEMAFASITKHAGKINEAKKEAIEILNGPYKDIAIEESKEIFNSGERIL